MRALMMEMPLTDRAHMPCGGRSSALAASRCYEEPLEKESEEAFTWPRLDENAAAVLCYTSGTTGAPKGVLYTQGAAAFSVALPDVGGFSEAGSADVPRQRLGHSLRRSADRGTAGPSRTALAACRPGRAVQGEGVPVALGVGLIRYLRASAPTSFGKRMRL